ncbi:hypothetical protein [Nonomuraea sp. NPDC003709]|uniref:hypothetical protein n=1 Tax=Nonomuraea sp. NPDC003709 TaxID=3154450 RepID=UPI0033A9E0EB
MVQRLLRHAGIVLIADTYISLLPHLSHGSVRMAARLVLKAVRATNRKIGKERAEA